MTHPERRRRGRAIRKQRRIMREHTAKWLELGKAAGRAARILKRFTDAMGTTPVKEKTP